jgi:hypothetical protein
MSITATWAGERALAHQFLLVAGLGDDLEPGLGENPRDPFAQQRRVLAELGTAAARAAGNSGVIDDQQAPSHSRDSAVSQAACAFGWPKAALRLTTNLSSAGSASAVGPSRSRAGRTVEQLANPPITATGMIDGTDLKPFPSSRRPPRGLRRRGGSQ